MFKFFIAHSTTPKITSQTTQNGKDRTVESQSVHQGMTEINTPSVHRDLSTHKTVSEAQSTSQGNPMASYLSKEISGHTRNNYE